MLTHYTSLLLYAITRIFSFFTYKRTRTTHCTHICIVNTIMDNLVWQADTTLFDYIVITFFIVALCYIWYILYKD